MRQTAAANCRCKLPLQTAADMCCRRAAHIIIHPRLADENGYADTFLGDGFGFATLHESKNTTKLEYM
eukprot:SAG11_NODE_4505_length_1870_cov_35.487860_1_plen_67_part_10